MKKREFLRNYRNTAVAAVIYSGLAAVGLLFFYRRQESIFDTRCNLNIGECIYRLRVGICEFEQRKLYRFYAVTSAASMFNIVSLLLSQQGQKYAGWKMEGCKML